MNGLLRILEYYLLGTFVGKVIAVVSSVTLEKLCCSLASRRAFFSKSFKIIHGLCINFQFPSEWRAKRVYNMIYFPVFRPLIGKELEYRISLLHDSIMCGKSGAIDAMGLLGPQGDSSIEFNSLRSLYFYFCGSNLIAAFVMQIHRRK